MTYSRTIDYRLYHLKSLKVSPTKGVSNGEQLVAGFLIVFYDKSLCWHLVTNLCMAVKHGVTAVHCQWHCHSDTPLWQSTVHGAGWLKVRKRASGTLRQSLICEAETLEIYNYLLDWWGRPHPYRVTAASHNEGLFVSPTGSLGKTVWSFISGLMSLNYRQYLWSYWQWYNVKDPMDIIGVDVNVLGRPMKYLDRRSSTLILQSREDWWSSCRTEIVNIDVSNNGKTDGILVDRISSALMLCCRKPMKYLPIGNRQHWCYVVGRPMKYLPIGNRWRWCYVVRKTDEVLADRRLSTLMLAMSGRPMEFHGWWSDNWQAMKIGDRRS